MENKIKKGSTEWKILGMLIVYCAEQLRGDLPLDSVFDSVVSLLDKGLLTVWTDGEVSGINSVAGLKEDGLIPKDYKPELGQYGKLFMGECKNIMDKES